MANSSTKPRAGRHGKRATKHASSIQGPETHAPNSGMSDVRRTGDSRKRLERHLMLARSAAMSGDEIAAEGHYQHAEHYFKMMNAGSV